MRKLTAPANKSGQATRSMASTRLPSTSWHPEAGWATGLILGRVLPKISDIKHNLLRQHPCLVVRTVVLHWILRMEVSPCDICKSNNPVRESDGFTSVLLCRSVAVARPNLNQLDHSAYLCNTWRATDMAPSAYSKSRLDIISAARPAPISTAGHKRQGSKSHRNIGRKRSSPAPLCGRNTYCSSSSSKP